VQKNVILIMICHFPVGSREGMYYSSVQLMEFEDVGLLSCTNTECKPFSFWNYHQVLQILPYAEIACEKQSK